MSDLQVPIQETPRGIIWESGIDEYDTVADIAWWHPTHIHHGGRSSASVVVSSVKGQVYVFNAESEYVGATERQIEGAFGPSAFEFWPLRRNNSFHPWLLAQEIRPSRCILARVDGILGVTDGDEAVTGRAWRVAYACLLLGYYPPMGLPWSATPECFRTGQNTLGDRSARRVKRVILARLAMERRVLRERIDEIEGTWR